MKRDFIAWVCLGYDPEAGLASVESVYLDHDEQRRPANALGKLYLVHTAENSFYRVERV